MDLIEKEIRDYLQANLGTNYTALSGTTTTNITINNTKRYKDTRNGRFV